MRLSKARNQLEVDDACLVGRRCRQLVALNLELAPFVLPLLLGGARSKTLVLLLQEDQACVTSCFTRSTCLCIKVKKRRVHDDDFANVEAAKVCHESFAAFLVFALGIKSGPIRDSFASPEQCLQRVCAVKLHLVSFVKQP